MRENILGGAKAIKEDNVHGVTVCHNTPELLVNAITSLRKYHFIPITIIDGCDRSPEGIYCKRVIELLRRSYSHITVIDCNGNNIGHGNGLHIGVIKATRDNVLIFDTDILLKGPALQLFQKVPYYAQGQMVYADERGKNADHGIKYIHPHFALINKRLYGKYPRFVSSGAPLLNAMRRVNRDRPDFLIDIPVGKSVIHLERGTRQILSAAPEPKRIVPKTRRFQHPGFLPQRQAP